MKPLLQAQALVEPNVTAKVEIRLLRNGQVNVQFFPQDKIVVLGLLALASNIVSASQPPQVPEGLKVA